MYEYYKGNEPSDETFFRNALVSTFGIDESLHDDFLNVYRENRHFLQTFGEKQTENIFSSVSTGSQIISSTMHQSSEKKNFCYNAI